jgi:hypothetical protein
MEQRMQGTITANWADQEPLTLDKLRQMMAMMPKPNVFLSMKIMPDDQAIQVEGEFERFTAAHPIFWEQVKERVSPTLAPSSSDLLGTTPRFFAGIEIIEVDPDAGDSAETAAWRDKWRRKLAAAFMAASARD